MTFPKTIFTGRILVVAFLAVSIVAVLTFVNHTQSQKPGIRPEVFRIDEKQFSRRIAERDQNIQDCERARGNWPRRYGPPDRFCENRFPYPLFQRDTTLSDEFIRSLSER